MDADAMKVARGVLPAGRELLTGAAGDTPPRRAPEPALSDGVDVDGPHSFLGPFARRVAERGGGEPGTGDPGADMERCMTRRPLLTLTGDVRVDDLCALCSAIKMRQNAVKST